MICTPASNRLPRTEARVARPAYSVFSIDPTDKTFRLIPMATPKPNTAPTRAESNRGSFLKRYNPNHADSILASFIPLSQWAHMGGKLISERVSRKALREKERRLEKKQQLMDDNRATDGP